MKQGTKMENLRSERNYSAAGIAVNGAVCPPARSSSNFVLRGTAAAPAVEYAAVLTRPSNQLLAQIPADRLRRIRPYLKQVYLSKDEYLYQQGDEISYVYFPESAVVSEFQIAEDGRMIEVSITGSEGGVGLAAAFNSCEAVNCTQICVAGTALKIESALLERESRSDGAFREVMLKAMNTQFRNLSQKLICNTFHSVEQRFCTWLLLLRNRSGMSKFRLTHEHIARVLGVHRPSVTFIAQHLRDAGLISYSRGRIAILDHKRLEKVACNCYAEIRAVGADLL